MALINDLRNKMGKVVVGVIAFAILSFVLADVLGPNSILFGNTSNHVGVIAGEKISFEEYNNLVERFAQNYSSNFGRNPSEREMVTIRNQAWEFLIVQKAFEKEYERTGIRVTDDELVDLVQGKNISPDIQNAPIFADPQTGTFSRDMLTRFLSSFNTQPVQLQQQWLSFESNLLPARKRIKYENLINLSNYVTDAEAQLLYAEQASTADISYVFIPFSSVPDSLISVTDKELQLYLTENSEDFQTEATRTIEYVSYPVIPSPEDSAIFRTELEDMSREFAAIQDDSIYARINTDGTNYFGTFNPKELTSYLQSNIDRLQEGVVVGPYLEGDALKINKVVEILDDTIQSARANHILIKWASESAEDKNKARIEASGILQQLRNGADFGELAREHGTDGTASVGGDLGWFVEGDMVGPFNDAVFNARNLGLLPRLVETEFGYHIIEVTELATNKVFKIATIERTIIASDETADRAFRKADYFAGTNSNYNDFKQSADEDSLNIREVSGIRADQTAITGITNARPIVRWTFNEASKGKISEVFEVDDAYVVAVLTEVVEEGTSPLSEVRASVERQVKNARKAEYISSKLSETTGTLEEMKDAYGEGARFGSMTGILGNATSIDNVGTAIEAIGAAFGLEQGQVTRPVKIASGVIKIRVDHIARAAAIADYSAYKDQILNNRQGRSSYYVSEAIKDASKIEDQRYKFY